MFAQCDFDNCGMIQSQIAAFAGCRFNASLPMLTGDVVAEGCKFTGIGAAFTQPGNVLVMNSDPGTKTLAGTQLNCGPNVIGQYLFGTPFA